MPEKKPRQTGDKRQKSRILAQLKNGPLTVINCKSPDLGIAGVNKRIAELLTGFSTDVLAYLASKGAVKPSVPAAPAAKPAAAPAAAPKK
mgnify:CR=1 FL=1